MSDTFKKESRKNWSQAGEGPISEDRLKLGCLQRIADATETMAQSYTGLIRERDRYVDYYKSEKDRREKAERSNVALRGQIAKLNNRIAELERELEAARNALASAN